MDEGLKWTVIHKDLPDTYPTLCNLIQRARNAVSQTHSPESILELILEIVMLATDMENRSGQAADWSVIEQIVLQSEPPNAGSIPTLCTWVMKYGTHSANDLKDFVYTCVPADREVNVEVLAAVSKWPADVDHTFPEVALALVMAEYNCSPEKVENGVTKFLNKSMIIALTRSRDVLVEANSLLKSFKAWTSKIGLKPEWKTALDGKLYTLVARMLCEASVPEDMDKCKLEAALSKIADDVIDLPSVNFLQEPPSKMKNPWAEYANTKEPVIENDRPIGQALIKYTDAGVVTGMEKRMLFSQGFSPGIKVIIQELKEDAGHAICIYTSVYFV